VQKEFGFQSTNAVIGHLKALEAKGYISRVAGQARAYKIMKLENRTVTSIGSPVGGSELQVIAGGASSGESSSTLTLSIYGTIAAGYPDLVESSNAIGSLQIDVNTSNVKNRNQAFALKVRGESMVNAGIHDGDIVIVEKTEPRPNDIVVALIDQESTLKRYVRKDNGEIYLKAENSNYPDLKPAGELIIQGVARSVIRCL
jgi:repressor LexA